jgi:hypothetical protein
MRQDSLHHGDGSKNIYLKLLPELFHGAFFQRSFVPIAGVVDQRVYRANVSLNVIYNSSNSFRLICNVEDPSKRGSRPKLLKLFNRLLFTDCANDRETRLQQSSCKCLAKPTAYTSDENHPLHSCSFSIPRVSLLYI